MVQTATLAAKLPDIDNIRGGPRSRLAMMMRVASCVLAVTLAVRPGSAADFSASDANLQSLKRTYCASFSDPKCTNGTAARQDWPNQVSSRAAGLAPLFDPTISPLFLFPFSDDFAGGTVV